MLDASDSIRGEALPHQQSIELIDVLGAVRHDTTGPRLGRIRDVGPAVAAALEAEKALTEKLKGRSISALVDQK